MKNDALISIILPIYNVEKYLEKCIQSVIAQTYSNIEIILVNDGSKDNSLEICNQYAERDNRIVVLDKKNGGLSDARNAGAKIAKGEYFVFIDSDDYIHHQMIELLYKGIVEKNAELAICDLQYVYEGKQVERENEKIDISKEIENITCFDRKKAIENILSENFIVYTVAWNKIYHRKLFNQIEYPFGKIHEDEFTTYRLLYCAERIAYIHQPLYYYVQRQNSIMSENFSEKRFHKVEAHKQRADFLIEHGLYESRAVKLYFFSFIIFIEKYISVFPENNKRFEMYKKEFKKEFRTYKKYLLKSDRIKLLLYFNFPKQYIKMQRKFKRIKKYF